MENYEERGIYGYAEKWFTENGYKWALKKAKRNGNLYTLSKEGFEFDYEIPCCVTAPKAFMEFIQKYFELYKRTCGQ